MVLVDFRNLLMTMLSAVGEPLNPPPSNTVLNSIINRGLNLYAAKTGVLFRPGISFTPIVNVAQYRTINPKYSDAIEDSGWSPGNPFAGTWLCTGSPSLLSPLTFTISFTPGNQTGTMTGPSNQSGTIDLQSGKFSNWEVLYNGSLMPYTGTMTITGLGTCTLSGRLGNSDPVTMTGSINPSISQVRVLASPMCLVDQIYINGAVLNKLSDADGSWMRSQPDSGQLGGWQGQNDPGESGFNDMVRYQSGFLTATPGSPTSWFQASPNAVTFSCPFDQAYPNCFFGGECYHTPLTVSAGGDQQTLDFPDDDLDLSSMVCANLLQRVLRLGDPALLMQEYKSLEGDMKRRRGAATTRNVGSTSRKGNRGRGGVWLTN